MVCYSCYSCCLIRVGVALTFSSHWCNFPSIPIMTVFFHVEGTTTFSNSMISTFFNNLLNVWKIFKKVFNDFHSRLLSKLDYNSNNLRGLKGNDYANHLWRNIPECPPFTGGKVASPWGTIETSKDLNNLMFHMFSILNIASKE